MAELCHNVRRCRQDPSGPAFDGDWARRSARCLTPFRWWRDITKSAGAIPNQPAALNHHGDVTHRDRKWYLRCRPPCRGVITKVQVQSSVARSRQLGRWLLDRRTSNRPGSIATTCRPHSVSCQQSDHREGPCAFTPTLAHHATATPTRLSSSPTTSPRTPRVLTQSGAQHRGVRVQRRHPQHDDSHEPAGTCLSLLPRESNQKVCSISGPTR